MWIILPLVTISPVPHSTPITKYDTTFPHPAYCPFCPELVRTFELPATPEPTLEVREVLELDVVEDDIVGRRVELVEVEEPLEVDVMAERSSPRCLASSCVPDEKEGLRSVSSFLVKMVETLLVI